MTALKTFATAALLALALAAPTAAQQAPPPPYGAPISLEAAKKAMAAAEAEAAKNSWPVAIAILDTTGSLVMLVKRDGTQTGSVAIAEGKAKTAMDFRRPTKAFQDMIAAGGGGLRFLALNNFTPLEGGVPIIVDGKIVGGIGVSGVASENDAKIAQAGADAAK
jgi:glc operon protein GlcG